MYWLQYFFHGAAEGHRGVGKSEVHDCWVVEAKGSFESSFPSVFFFDVDVIVSPLDIHFGK